MKSLPTTHLTQKRSPPILLIDHTAKYDTTYGARLEVLDERIKKFGRKVLHDWQFTGSQR